MKTIHKFQCFPPGAPFTYTMPEGAVVLTAQMQGDKMVFWALLDPASTIIVARRFVVYGTGWDMPEDNLRYCGTVQDSLGFVWHLFEVTK